MADYIPNNTQEEQANIIAQHLPNDRLFEAKNIEESTFRKMLVGLASGFVEFNDNLNNFAKEGNIKEANALLEEWERTFGIPDDCLATDGTLEQRRNNILIKLAGLQGTFIQQCEYVFNLLGYEGVQIVNAYSYTQIPTPIPSPIVSNTSVPFILFIIIPSTYQLSTIPSSIPTPLFNPIPQIECIINKLKPANVKIFYQFAVQQNNITSYLTINNSFLTLGGNNFLVI